MSQGSHTWAVAAGSVVERAFWGGLCDCIGEKVWEWSRVDACGSIGCCDVVQGRGEVSGLGGQVGGGGGRGRREENLISSGARSAAKSEGLDDGLDQGWRGKKVIEIPEQRRRQFPETGKKESQPGWKQAPRTPP